MTSPAPADLAGVSLFAGLAPADRDVVAQWLDVEEVDAGTRLTRQGAPGYTFFVLVSGSASVEIDGEQVRVLGDGDFFGEVSMIAPVGGRQTATVVALTPSRVWRMFGSRFRELQAEHPQVASALEAAAMQRLQDGSAH